MRPRLMPINQYPGLHSGWLRIFIMSTLRLTRLEGGTCQLEANTHSVLQYCIYAQQASNFILKNKKAV